MIRTYSDQGPNCGVERALELVLEALAFLQKGAPLVLV